MHRLSPTPPRLGEYNGSAHPVKSWQENRLAPSGLTKSSPHSEAVGWAGCIALAIQRLKRDVAIKVLARAGADPVRRQRFTDEAQAASALNHPNILTVYDVGVHDDTPYIVSEIIEGSSIRDMLARAPMSVARCARSRLCRWPTASRPRIRPASCTAISSLRT